MIEQPPQNELDEQDEPDDEASPEETEAYETMVSGLRNHIFGTAEESIRNKLRESKDPVTEIGNMMLALVMEAASQANQAGVETSFELLVSVGTEVIDDLLELAEAMGVVKAITDDDREKALFTAVQGYLVSADVPPEEQELAKEQLAEMHASGEVDRVAAHVRERAIREEGVDPFANGEQVPARPRMMEG